MSLEPKPTSSYCFFYPTNSPKISVSIFAIINEKEKQQVLIKLELEPANV